MLYYVCNVYGEIGEVVNTADCGSVMQGFDSLISPQNEFYPYFIRVFIFHTKFHTKFIFILL